MAEFFIRRPIVAIVISILIVLLGLFTLSGLSIEQYPFLAPPTIRVTATYPGASAVAVEQSVATPIEQEVNGVENMIYMKSSNTSDGRMQLDVNFAVGVDQDNANVLTQNRVSIAQSRLPQEVVQQGVTVKKMSPSILMLISLYSPDGTYDGNYLINYCGINLRDQLLRIPGVAQVDLFGGTDYGMRIWLEPDKLATFGLTPADVSAAIREQNLQAPGGRIGMAPSPPGQEFTYTVNAPGRLVSPAEFEDIIIRETEDGGQIQIRDIGRVGPGQMRGNGKGLVLVDDDLLGVRAAAHEAHDAVARLPAAGLLSHRVDLTGVLQSGNVGGPAGRRGISPFALDHVGAIEAGRPHRDANLTRSRRWLGEAVIQDHDVGPAGRGVGNGAHAH
jgi:multidrug efflux pump subunit AcrB